MMNSGIRHATKRLLAKWPVLDGTFRRFIWSRMHFPEEEMRLVELAGKTCKFDIAIDVGAALGAYSWIMSRSSRSVYAFEPGNVHGDYMARVLFGSNITLERKAVGAAPGVVRLFVPSADEIGYHSATVSSSNPVVTGALKVEEVEQISLDTYFADKVKQGRSVDLVKVDVEGYELEVFRGALETLNRFHPVVVCEIEARHNPEYQKVFELMEDLGYVTWYRRDGVSCQLAVKNLDDLQRPDALDARLKGTQRAEEYTYINNFMFQHPLSRVRIVP